MGAGSSLRLSANALGTQLPPRATTPASLSPSLVNAVMPQENAEGQQGEGQKPPWLPSAVDLSQPGLDGAGPGQLV